MSNRLPRNHCTKTMSWYDCGHLEGEVFKTCGLEATDRNHPPVRPHFQYLEAECCECEKLQQTPEKAAFVEQLKNEATTEMNEQMRKYRNQYSVIQKRNAREKRNAETLLRSDSIEAESAVETICVGGKRIKHEIEGGRKRIKHNQPEMERMMAVEVSAHQTSMVEDAMLLVHFAKKTQFLYGY